VDTTDPERAAWFAEEARQQAEASRAAERAYANIEADEAAARAAMEFNSGNWDRIASCTVTLDSRDQADTWAGTLGTDGDSAVAAHIVRWRPPTVLSYCASVHDALKDLERISVRSPDPDSRMWARSAIHALASAWTPLEEPETIRGELVPQALDDGGGQGWPSSGG
jgi:hypothetical protein